MNFEHQLSQFGSKSKISVRFVLLIFILFFLACPDPPIEEDEPFECDIPGAVICEDDTTACCCIENASWNADSTACECDELYEWDGDSACVMITTDHAMTFIADSLGVYPSILRDAAITDDGGIIAVGQIMVPDTTAYGWKTYNAARFYPETETWELFNIEAYTPWGSLISPEMYSIQYFSENSIWVTSYGSPYYWDGFSWTMHRLPSIGINVSVQNLWGPSADEMYFIGRHGAIVSYKNDVFTLMESGTDFRLRSISGTSGDNIWVSSNLSYSYGEPWIVLHYDGLEWSEICTGTPAFTHIPDSISTNIYGVYTNSTTNAFVLTAMSLYITPNNSQCNAERLNYYPAGWSFEPQKIIGQAQNDIFIVGDFSMIYHFNGEEFFEYPRFNENVDFLSADVKDDFFIAVGDANSYVYIIRGYR